MNPVVAHALTLWGLSDAQVHLVAKRENEVFRITATTGQSLALRLHRPGYRNDAELRAELQWMAALATGGLNVPAPVPALDGVALQRVEDTQVSMLSWLNATPLGMLGVPLNVPNRLETFHALGVEMAKLHDVSDRWAPPAGFERWSWDRTGLLGDAPLWDRFWENPTLDRDLRELLIRFRQHALARLSTEQESLDFGLIHADLVPENVMRAEDGTLYMIDFDDGGFGFRLFDIATALIKHRVEPDFTDLRAALIEGYQSQRTLDVGGLEFFMALRAVTYVGWIITRMGEDGAPARNKRFLAQAKALISAF